MTKLPLLISVPHAGLSVPQEVESLCVLTEGQIEEDSDEYAAEIYAIEDQVESFVTADVARAIVDMNRAEEDRGPDGVIKTHTCMNVPVYDSFPPEETLELLLSRYYRPYHTRLHELSSSSIRLGIDCHTMLETGPPIGPLAGKERPRICLCDACGSSCPPQMTWALAACLEEAFGFEVAVNYPFKGGFILRHHSTDRPWLQLELSRSGFMTSGEKRECVIRALRSFFDRLD